MSVQMSLVVLGVSVVLLADVSLFTAMTLFAGRQEQYTAFKGPSSAIPKSFFCGLA